MDKDVELHRFASGTRHFATPARTTLPEALKSLGKQISERLYRRTKKQMDDAKIVRDRIMGESND